MRPVRLCHVLTALLFTDLLFTSPLAAQKPPPSFDGYVRRVMQTFTVPGLSVAIVKDGKVVLAKGYGFSFDFQDLVLRPVRPDSGTTH